MWGGGRPGGCNSLGKWGKNNVGAGFDGEVLQRTFWYSHLEAGAQAVAGNWVGNYMGHT